MLAAADLTLPDSTTSADAVRVRFRSVNVRPGAVETIFELGGVLTVAAGVVGDVAIGVVSNWIWSLVSAWRSKRPAPQPRNDLHIEVTHPYGTRVSIDARTRESILASVKDALTPHAP